MKARDFLLAVSLLLGLPLGGCNPGGSEKQRPPEVTVNPPAESPAAVLQKPAPTPTPETAAPETGAPAIVVSDVTPEKGLATEKDSLQNRKVNEVNASSYFTRQPPGAVLDGISLTAWNARGDSEAKEWLEFAFETPTAVSTIVFTPGWEKAGNNFNSLFYGNSRAKKVRLLLDGKSSAVMEVGQHQRRAAFTGINATVARIRLEFLETWPGDKWRQLAISDVEIFGKPPAALPRKGPCEIVVDDPDVRLPEELRDDVVLSAVFPSYIRSTGRVGRPVTCTLETAEIFDGIEPLSESAGQKSGWDPRLYPVVGYRQTLPDGRLVAWVVTYRDEAEEAGVLALVELKEGVARALPGVDWAARRDGERKLVHHVLNGRDVWTTSYGSTGTGGGGDSEGDDVWLQKSDRLTKIGSYETSSYFTEVDGNRGVRSSKTTAQWKPNELILKYAVTTGCMDDNGNVGQKDRETLEKRFMVQNDELVLTLDDSAEVVYSCGDEE